MTSTSAARHAASDTSLTNAAPKRSRREVAVAGASGPTVRSTAGEVGAAAVVSCGAAARVASETATGSIDGTEEPIAVAEADFTSSAATPSTGIAAASSAAAAGAACRAPLASSTNGHAAAAEGAAAPCEGWCSAELRSSTFTAAARASRRCTASFRGCANAGSCTALSRSRSSSIWLLPGASVAGALVGMAATWLRIVR